MKKTLWLISALSAVITAIGVNFLPETVPMHYGLQGSADRWGSKYEMFLFPLAILALTLLFHLLIAHYEKKAACAETEKLRVGSLVNARVIALAGVSVLCMLTAMQVFQLYNAYVSAAASSAPAADISAVSVSLLGVLLIVLGNLMPKSKPNKSFGLRVSWSEYNDVTWRKSNLFGGAAMMAAGGLTLLGSAFTRGVVPVLLMLGFLTAALIASLLYARRVYLEETAKEGAEQ